MRRRPPATLLCLIAAAPALAGCGAQRQPAPDTATPQPPRGTVTVRLPAAGVRLRAPRTWTRVSAPAPGILTLASGRATVTLWRYPRTEPLPRTTAALRQARKDLLAATRARDPSFDLASLRRTCIDGRPALDLRGTATVAGRQRAVRSVHVYAFGAELVLDALAEPAQARRVARQVVVPLVRSLRLSRARP